MSINIFQNKQILFNLLLKALISAGSLAYFGINLPAQNSINVYLIPGQGADDRLFNEMVLDSNFQINYITYSTPDRKMDMSDYALFLAQQIDTTEKFILIGTSLGGMLAVEMTAFLDPEKVIIISSAKARNELPFRYRFQKIVPIFELVPKGVIKRGALFLQPLVEPDSRNQRELFKAMLSAKDPKFLKRTIRMIIHWEPEKVSSEITHIHGESDKTIPLKSIQCDYIIKNGSHMLTLTKANLLNEILQKELESFK